MGKRGRLLILLAGLAVLGGVLWLAGSRAQQASAPAPTTTNYLVPLPAPTSAGCHPQPCVSVDGLELIVSGVDRHPALASCAAGRSVIRVDLTFVAVSGTHEVIAGSGIYLAVGAQQIAPDFTACVGEIPLQRRLGPGTSAEVSEYFDAAPPSAFAIQWYPDVPVPYGHRRLPVAIPVSN